MKLALIANTSWYLYNFRRSLIKKLIEKGHTVYVIAPKDNYSRKLVESGAIFIHWDVGRTNINPMSEFLSLLRLNRVLQQSKIHLVLSYTPKGNIHASLSCLFRRKRILNNISGLGVSVTEKSPVSFILYHLYRFILRFSALVFFQNNDDKELILSGLPEGIIKAGSLPGSGVDINEFSKDSESSAPRFNFLLSARLLEEKGVYDYVEASTIVRRIYPTATFAIAGQIERYHTSAINQAELDEWHQVNNVEYLGFTDDIKSFLRETTCFVLPSYYGEGVPRGLLEAASMAKPIITTNHPGCKDAVDDKRSGFLCQIKNPKDLADKMLKILNMPKYDLRTMGLNGREKMVKEFSEEIVINKYLSAIRKHENDN